MKVYQGWRGPSGHGSVSSHGPNGSAPLPRGEHVWKYSSNPFHWGQGDCPESYQLGLALLLDATRSAEIALTYGEVLADRVLARMGRGDWELSEEWLLRWCVSLFHEMLAVPTQFSIVWGWHDDPAKN